MRDGFVVLSCLGIKVSKSNRVSGESFVGF